MRNFQDTFKTSKRSFIIAFSICMTVPLTKMLFNKFLIWIFWGQNVGPGWVKNGKKGSFHD